MWFNTNLTPFFFTSLVLVALTGCKEAPSIPNIPSEVVFMNEGLAKKMAIQNLSTRTINGLREIELRATNNTSKKLKIVYKIDWLEQGRTIPTLTSRWVTTEIEEHRDAVIRGIAPTPSVNGFKVRLDYPSASDKKRLNSYQYQYQGE